jgi:hypothetical protein
LVAELQHTEVLLSTIVTKYAFLAGTAAEKARVASEWRWFATIGVVRSRGAGLGLTEAPEGMDRVLELADDHLVAVLAARTPEETVGGTIILPVLDATLAGRTSGFTAAEIQALSLVRWQSHLLEQDAHWTAEFLRLSLTVKEGNYDIVIRNHKNRRHAYAHRAGVLLDCARAALTALGAGHE